MAVPYTNTVPLGREGSGAAQVFGPNKALQYALQRNMRDQDRLMEEQRVFQGRQYQQNQAFQKSIMDLSELAATPMFSEDFNKITNDLMRQGGELMSQGINPYNPNQSPESRAAVAQWNGEINKLKSAKLAVENMFKERQDLAKRYSQNPQNYNFDDFQALMDFEKNNSLEDIISNGVRLPQISERVNIGEEAIKQYGEVYAGGTEFTQDAQGNPIRRTVRDVDRNRIAQITNNEFTSNTKYGSEVNQRLRRELGQGVTIDSLIGTTNPEEVRAELDRQFRSPNPSNPIVTLLSEGQEVQPGTAGYDQFLDRAVQEQLKGEVILDTAKQEMANALIGNTNTNSTEVFDFSLQNQARANRSEQRAAASFRSSEVLKGLRAQRLINGTDDVVNAMIDEAEDIDFTEDYGDGEVDPGITVFGAIPQSTPNVSINPSSTIDVKSGAKGKGNEFRGNITGIGLVGVDKDGNVVRGSSPEELLRNPSVVKFEPQVVVQNNKKRSSLYSPSSVPFSSLSKAKEANARKALGIQTKAATELNNQIKARSSSTAPAQTNNRSQNKNVIGLPSGGF